MTPAEVAIAKAMSANHPSVHRSVSPVAVGVQVPGEADDLHLSVSLGEIPIGRGASVAGTGHSQRRVDPREGMGRSGRASSGSEPQAQQADAGNARGADSSAWHPNLTTVSGGTPTLGELDEMLVPLDGLVARLRLLRGGRS